MVYQQCLLTAGCDETGSFVKCGDAGILNAELTGDNIERIGFQGDPERVGNYPIDCGKPFHHHFYCVPGNVDTGDIGSFAAKDLNHKFHNGTVSAGDINNFCRSGFCG